MDNKELNAAVNQLVELMDESFGLPGYKDYIKENFFMAVEVLKNSGNIYDLDKESAKYIEDAIKKAMNGINPVTGEAYESKAVSQKISYNFKVSQNGQFSFI